MVEPWVKQLVADVVGESQLEIGKRVKHPKGYMVEIVGGQYWGLYGLSNFWSWRRINKNGTLSKKVESGYGWV